MIMADDSLMRVTDCSQHIPLTGFPRLYSATVHSRLKTSSLFKLSYYSCNHTTISIADCQHNTMLSPWPELLGFLQEKAWLLQI